MPELPEVETHVRDLQKVIGRTFTELWTDTPKAFRPKFATFKKNLLGQKILTITRRAKYIIFTLADNSKLVCHFRMTGHFLIRRVTAPLERFVRHRLILDRGLELRFEDIRKFGTLTLCDEKSFEKVCGFAALGPEPLESGFTFEVFRNILRRKRGKLKAVLLDQRVIAGIGNIYADEICFTAGLHPASRVEKLSDVHLRTLHRAIISELKKGVANRGTTVGEFVDSSGHAGSNQLTLNVYSRHGEKCRKCGTILKKMKISQRTTTYCARDQKLVS